MTRSYDYEDGLRDHCVDDPLWAADEIERLRAERQDHLWLLRGSRITLDAIAVGREAAAEASAQAQRIVDHIGHDVTDEPPHTLVEIERLRAERAGMQRERQSHYVRVEDPPDGWVWLSNHFDEDAEVMHELWANHRELEGRELRFVATRLVWRERFVTEWVDEDRGA